MAKKDDEVQYLVAEFQIHNPPAWVRELAEHLQTKCSLIVARTLQRLQDALVIEWLDQLDQKKAPKMARALLKLELSISQRDRVRNLVDPSRLSEEKRAKRRVYNSYGFVSEDDAEREGVFLATVRLMERVETGEFDKNGEPKYRKEAIAVTTGLQQLIMSFLKPSGIENFPRELQSGVAQEIAQQLMSHVQLKDSGAVEEANFPTLEERDPAARRQRYAEALTACAAKPVQLERRPYPEVQPERFARIEKNGPPELAEKLRNRKVIADEDWHNVARKPHPPRTPLLFVDADACQVFRGYKEVEAGVSKADMCRGKDRLFGADTKVRKPDKVEQRGKTSVNPYYLALPLIHPDDEKAAEILRRRDQRVASQRHSGGQSGRGWDFDLSGCPMWGEEPYVPHTGKRKVITRRVLLPLKFGDRAKRDILENPDLQPCWSRLVVKGKKDIRWQLTYRVDLPETPRTNRVLGVHFHPDHLAWCLLDENGSVEQRGIMWGNRHLQAHLQAAEERSWDQKAGRWIGGRVNQKRLRNETYAVVGKLIALAKSCGARLCVEEIRWVSKRAASAPENQRFSGWNYGQLRRFLAYKAPMAGIGQVLTVSDYVVKFTCPACGARREKGQKKDTADTYYDVKTSRLSCRKCGFEGELEPRNKADTAARWGANLLLEAEEV